MILLKKRFYWTNDFKEKKRLYLTIVKWENEQMNGKLTIILRMNKINFFWTKRTKLIIHKPWSKEQNEKAELVL